MYVFLTLERMSSFSQAVLMISSTIAGTGTLPTSWTPIGATKAFAGTFDGQMHTIRGLYLNTSSQFAGLFGQIDASGVVKNFYITDSLFKSTSYDLKHMTFVNG